MSTFYLKSCAGIGLEGQLRNISISAGGLNQHRNLYHLYGKVPKTKLSEEHTVAYTLYVNNYWYTVIFLFQLNYRRKVTKEKTVLNIAQNMRSLTIYIQRQSVNVNITNGIYPCMQYTGFFCLFFFIKNHWFFTRNYNSRATKASMRWKIKIHSTPTF